MIGIVMMKGKWRRWKDWKEEDEFIGGHTERVTTETPLWKTLIAPCTRPTWNARQAIRLEKNRLLRVASRNSQRSSNMCSRRLRMRWVIWRKISRTMNGDASALGSSHARMHWGRFVKRTKHMANRRQFIFWCREPSFLIVEWEGGEEGLCLPLSHQRCRTWDFPSRWPVAFRYTLRQ